MIDYYNRLPRYVFIKNEKFIINSDFRIFINFELEMQGTNKEKAIEYALRQFYPAFFKIIEKNLLNEAVEKFIWFYKCGKEEYNENKTTNKHSKKISQIFNYVYDCDLICGSFWIYAHTDLHKYCHWWRFKEIWNNLPQDCEFNKIKGYRAYDGDDKNLLELKEFYKLPPTEEELKDEIRRKEIYEALK